jgi:AraC-like DNA-binding protein
VQTPTPALRPFVKRFLVVASPVAHQDSHLPNTGLVAAVVIGGDCIVNGTTKAPRAALTGLWDIVRTHDHGRDNMVVLAEFTATGAAALLRQPLDAFSNATVDMEGILARRDDLERMHEHMVRAANHARRVQVVEDLLLARAAGARPDPLVSVAVSWIEHARAAVRVEDLARRIGLSQSALERRFRRSVGASPRKFASIVRIQHVARLRAAGNDFTTIAHAAGYCDQAHFIKDFKRFSGVAPEAYFRQAGVGRSMLSGNHAST